MRIAIYDNVAQNAYVQAKVLRRCGQPVDLVLTPADPIVFSDPRWEDLDLELPTEELQPASLPDIDLPPWVRRTSPLSGMRRYAQVAVALVRSPRALWTAWRTAGLQGLAIAIGHSRIIQQLRRYDCVIAYGMGPVFAALARVPCLAQTYGADIIQIPFQDADPKAHPQRVAEARLQRWGLERAVRILATDPRFFPDIDRLGLSDKGAFVPFLIDTEKYSPGEDAELRAQFLDDGQEFLLFVPSRQDWYWKGSDLMLRGFAEAFRERDDAVLVCAGWGGDIERSRHLADDLGIASKVRFLPFAMSKTRLLRYYRAADIVMDQFTVGSYGSSALEAMSCARPLMIYLNPERFSKVFAEFPPVANVKTPHTIAAELVRLVEDLSARLEMGEHARRWILDNHGTSVVDRTLALCLSAVASGD